MPILKEDTFAVARWSLRFSLKPFLVPTTWEISVK